MAKTTLEVRLELTTFGLEVQRAIHCANGTLHTILVGWMVIFGVLGCTCFGSTYTKIGTIQRRLAWPLHKDDTQNREAFHILCPHPRDAVNDQGKRPGQFSVHVFFRAFPPLGEPTEGWDPG